MKVYRALKRFKKEKATRIKVIFEKERKNGHYAQAAKMPPIKSKHTK